MYATIDFTLDQKKLMCESMDLEWDDILEILERADIAWQDIKNSPAHRTEAAYPPIIEDLLRRIEKLERRVL